MPETVICACRRRVAYRSGVRVRRCPRVGMGPGGYEGGYTGWVIGRAIPVPSHAARGAHPDSEAGPGDPAGGGVGGQGGRAYLGARRRSQNPPFGPGRSALPPSLVLGPYCRLLAHMARFDLISQKLSQNPRVSPKYVQKA